MSSSNVSLTPGNKANIASRVVVFGLVGALSLGVAGGVEGTIALYVFRAIELSLFPHYGAFVMTALSSGLPIVLSITGVLVGSVGMACFGSGRRAQENAKALRNLLMRNTLPGTALGVFLGGITALTIGRSQSQEPITLFSTFFAGVFFGFLLGLVFSLLLSIKSKFAAD